MTAYGSQDRLASPELDSESEDDLDLGELDPVTSTARFGVSGRTSQDGDRGSRVASAGIALRSLGARSHGRGWRRKDNDGEDQEDLQGLLNDDVEGYGRGSHDAGGYDSDFQRPRRGRRQPHLDRGKLSVLGSRMRLPSSRSGIQLPEVALAEPEDTQVEGDPKAARDVLVGQSQQRRYPANVVSNAKYTPWSFLPRTLYNEFSYFLNIYFLLVALSQILPFLRIGYMSTYIAPLASVLTITIGKEAIDDIARRRRDVEANAEPYTVLSLEDPANRQSSRRRQATTSRIGTKNRDEPGTWDVIKRARDLKVGDILKLTKNQRLPADVVILKSIPNDVAAFEVNNPSSDEPSESLNHSAVSQSQTTSSSADSGETFIRTDQLDGETDWKLRLPSALTQKLPAREFARLKVSAGAPDRKVNDFVGNIELSPNTRITYDPHLDKKQDPNVDGSSDVHATAPEDEMEAKNAALTIDNTAWANTVLASNTTTLAVIIYTGSQTRSALSTSASRSKTGLLEEEINNLTKILCALTLTISIILVALEGFQPTNDKPWYVAILMYLILFSTIIPISLRVNLDMGKTVYARFIERDEGIPDTVVRTSTIPEDLGRIEYLLSDKTGTLTQNEMELKKIHVGTVSYANEAMEEVMTYTKQGFSTSSNDALAPMTLITPSSSHNSQSNIVSTTRTRREIGSRVRDLVLALALCHNVTPTTDEIDGQNVVTYQASSPDEIAIVRYTEAVGLRLLHRDRKSIALQSVDSGKVVVRVKILDNFPFTSDSKRMGIIVQFIGGAETVGNTGNLDSEIWFYQKGADTVMTSIVAANDWLDEETANMAREGLRTLVVGRKRLSTTEYEAFSSEYKIASLALQNRDTGMASVVKRHLEHDLELLGVTGVEDKLQKDVKTSLELLRNAGVKIWMLTGDKVETARCVAISAKLVARGQYIHTIAKMRQKAAAQDALDFLRNKTDSALLIDGESLALMLTHFRTQFVSLAVLLPAVIACRCSPTQKAEVAYLIRQHTHKRVCCIGDGGNDVSMIQAADVGIGIVGKEGRQASLAADFSITQFCHLTKLLVWHGRNSYKRSAKLAQFIIHRGLIIAVCQTMYSIASHFDPDGLFIDWLLVGYATVYTMAPVFSLVFDRDVDESLANLYPELYKELKTGQSLSYTTFFTWVAVSIYQGCIIQGLSQILVHQVKGPRMISVSFTVLILNELIMVAVSVTTWHPIMIASIVGTAAIYAASVPFLGGYFDLEYIITWGWVWRVAAVAAISLVPVYGGKLIRRAWKPPSYRKVQGI
ncbi:putative phospholipid-translocating p-type atpase [Phaeomoniella chlamydospora]|uniref:Phospholipid-transporting ATPase n=1 Tax=Phaeomoniella chlamydospora TaxID=158046 RepID=A0A0G2GHB2_PHACM|nr:putative phospholipid-translocating p-type atpase [Phaeomoniella chlamydospora]